MVEPARTDTSPSADNPSDGRNLLVAVAVGAALAAIFLVSLFWHPLAFALVVLALVIVGTIETARALRHAGRPVALPVALTASSVLVIGAYLAGAVGQVVGVLTLFLGAGLWELGDRHRHDAVGRMARTSFLVLWTGFLGSFGVLLVHRPAEGAVAGLAVIGAAIFTDIGAYAVGTLLGRHKLAPSISPAKSWEGLVGGLALAGLVAVLVLPRIGSLFERPLVALTVAVLAGLAGALGDLLESMFKRDLGIKDMGSLLPGHGGILDRVDGILIALPVGYYAIELLI